MDVLIDGLAFPEGPRWRGDRLFFSDFYTHRVQSTDLSGRLELVARVPQQPSGLGWLPDGSLLIVSMLDRRLLRLSGGVVAAYAELGDIATGPANDLVVDSQGRAFVGDMGFNRRLGEAPRHGHLTCVHPDGRVVLAADEMVFPNGAVVSPDGRRLIVAESFANRLTVFDLQDDGRLTNRRLYADLGDCSPDGICQDAEGAIWVAHPQGDAVLRVLEGGRVVDRVVTGERGAFACALGGPDGQTLFVCTNDLARLGPEPSFNGRIEVARVAVPA